MAGDAQRPHILEIRVAAFDDGQDVIRFPPRFASFVDRALLL
jgi:hypothetical protein